MLDGKTGPGHRRHRLARAGCWSGACSAASSGVPAEVIVFSRDEAKQHEMRLALPAPHRRHRRRHLRETGSRLQFRIGDVRDSAPSAAVLARRRRRLPRGRAQAGADLRVPPDRGGADERRSARENIVRAIREQRLAGRDRGRRLHRQGLQAGQRDGHDQGAAGAHLRPRPTSMPGTPASSPSATATSSPRAAR